MQLADTVAVVCLLELCLQRAQPGVAIDDEFDRGTLERGRFLRDVGDAPVLRQLDVALVGMQLVAQQREQARLARAVGPDQADVLARVEREVGGLEQRPWRRVGR